MSALILVVETLVAPLAALGVVLPFLLSPKRGRLSGLADELPERLGGVPPEVRERLRGRDVWWLHAASAGEVAGLAPVAEILARAPGRALVLTTTTRSGREAARALPGVAWAQLAPLDAWPLVARFLRALAPRRLVLAETELWPTTLILAARAGLKPSLVNARLTPASLSAYSRVRALLAPALESLALVGAQSELDAERFRSLGAPSARVRVTGNAKYDRVPPPVAGEAFDARLRELGWEGAPLFVAASTHPVEEEIVLGAWLAARRAAPGLKLVLAPRHLERAPDAADLLARAGLSVARWSGGNAPAEALLLDRMGVLPSAFPRARAAFVGGTLVPVGGHNLLEPALAGVPVLFGPHTGHIEHPAVLLESGGGGWRVAGAEELAARLTELVLDEPRARAVGGKARELARRLSGAARRTAEVLEAA
jgi:3-deoxy-D-manno-octulosonic-acid transferase